MYSVHHRQICVYTNRDPVCPCTEKGRFHMLWHLHLHVKDNSLLQILLHPAFCSLRNEKRDIRRVNRVHCG
jgi:hypothetical protein